MTLPALADAVVPDVNDDIDPDLALARVCAADRSALAVLRDRLSPRVRELLVRMLGESSAGLCDALMEDVFAEVWARAQEGTAPQFSAEPWILALAHRRAVEHLDTAGIAA